MLPGTGSHFHGGASSSVPAFRGEVEQGGEDVVPAHPVDGGVVDLGVDRDLAALEPVDQVQLPQRPPAVERPGVQPGRLLGELLVVTRGGQRQLADVELDVEIGVLDPVRLVDPERHLDQSPPERRQQVQAGLHHFGEVLEGERFRRRGRVEDADAADVPVDRRGLHGQEGRVESGELLHVVCLPRGDPAHANRRRASSASVVRAKLPRSAVGASVRRSELRGAGVRRRAAPPARRPSGAGPRPPSASSGSGSTSSTSSTGPSGSGYRRVEA